MKFGLIGVQTDRVRYSRVGANREKPKVLRYSAVSQGNLAPTEVDSQEESVSICFKDMQKLELIHEMLSACSAILDSSVEIAGGCLKYCQALEGPDEVRGASCNKLELCICRLRMHARATELVLKQSEKTAQVVTLPTSLISVMHGQLTAAAIPNPRFQECRGDHQEQPHDATYAEIINRPGSLCERGDRVPADTQRASTGRCQAY
jgi:hypothetical protein